MVEITDVVRMTHQKAYKPEPRWTTVDEIRFIDGVGTFGLAPNKITPRERYRRLLVAYNQRRVWGGIDARKVIKHLKEKLAACPE